MFFSLAHILYMLVPPALLAVFYFLLRKRSARIQKAVIFILMLLNVLQHLLKIYIYPQYKGESFGARSTAYNMCALLILISPVIFLVGSELWKNFITYVGTVAGSISIFVTYWLVEPPAEQIRFVLCHTVLFLTSILPALFGIYKINYRKCWRLPFVFYACLMVLIVNNIITYTLGIVGDIGNVSLQQFLINENPCWAMGAPAGYPVIERIVDFFTPDVFYGVPILWYAIPLFLLISLGAFGLGVIFDNGRFKTDISALKVKSRELHTKIKSKLNSKEKK